MSFEGEMHQLTNRNASSLRNGFVAFNLCNTSANSQNGDSYDNTNETSIKKIDRDIIRLVGQHLKGIGLNSTADILLKESGCRLDHPSASKFRQHVLDGEWSKAENDLNDLECVLNNKAEASKEMKFLILEQKYLEYLEEGRAIDALHVLRNELSPLQHNIERVHTLSSYIMICSRDDLLNRAKWYGKGLLSRTKLMDKLQQFFPPYVMMPPNRLRTLLSQAVELQWKKCTFHNTIDEEKLEDKSLLTDHMCIKETFPCETIQILSEHCDEVWYCEFSPDGLKLATGSKDNTVIVWDVNPETLNCTQRKNIDAHADGVQFLSWSPDSSRILICGPENCSEIIIWHVDSDDTYLRMNNSSDDSLTWCSWHKSGKKFYCGGAKGSFYECDIEGTILNTWEGIRIHGIACRSDEKHVIASDSHRRIRSYNFETETDNPLLQEENLILSFTINKADNLAALNIDNEGVHLWDLERMCMVRKFQGMSQGHFPIHSSFGGASNEFVASGSDDNKVYIWHVGNEKPVAILSGHSRTVNNVSWNPAFHQMMASASDDWSIRIWGPSYKNVQLTSTNEISSTNNCNLSD